MKGKYKIRDPELLRIIKSQHIQRPQDINDERPELYDYDLTNFASI